jgi:hypothetical protein
MRRLLSVSFLLALLGSQVALGQIRNDSASCPKGQVRQGQQETVCRYHKYDGSRYVNGSCYCVYSQPKEDVVTVCPAGFQTIADPLCPVPYEIRSKSRSEANCQKICDSQAGLNPNKPGSEPTGLPKVDPKRLSAPCCSVPGKGRGLD